MAGRIPQAFIDDLLSRVDIVEIIDRYVPLKKAGANHKACCPFHGEKTPSFSVNQQKQFYHCFGCQASGNAISFLMEFDHMHFVDAVEYLANRVGLEVPRDAVAAITPSQQGLFDALDTCSQFYQQQLRKTPKAIEYLKQRGISGETAGRFELGFSPDAWHALTENLTENTTGNTAENTQVSNSSLFQSGMLVRNESGKFHDRFRNRIMYPIRDRRGRVIGFGGRVMDNSEPKYLNSPETPLFQKGRELYGLYELRRATRGNPERIIVVEGYMDVIALAHAGIDTSVATLGTATSSEQVALLFRETDEIVFCFDGDAAGKKAAWRALQSALPSLKAGRDARFLFLPDGEDPDTLVKSAGAEQFMQSLADNALDAASFLFQQLELQASKGQVQTGSEQSSTGHKARLAEIAKPLISTIPTGVYRTLVEDQLHEKVGVTVFRQPDAAQLPTKQQPSVSRRQTKIQTGLSPIRKALIAILDTPSIVLEIDPEAYEFSIDIAGATLLLDVISLIESRPDITTSGILERYRETDQSDSLHKLARAGMESTAESEVDTPLSVLQHAIEQLNRESLRLELKQDTGDLQAPSAMSDAQKDELRKRLERLKK